MLDRFVLVLLLTGILIALNVCRGKAETLSDISARATRTTVYIKAPFVDHNTGTRKDNEVGSGFIVPVDGVIVTAYHVISDWLKQDEADRAANPVSIRIGSKYAPAIEVAYLTGDEAADLALLRILAPQTNPAAPVCFVTSMQPGAYLFGFGFPNNHDLTPMPGTFSNINGEGNRWEAAGAFTNGMSGGPVYNEKGFVVGVIQGGVPLSAATNFVTPLRWARSMLESRTAIKQACFGICRVQANGVESWTTKIPWHQDTEWMGGGHNPGNECTKLQATYTQAHPGQELELTRTDERNDKDFLGHVTYQYICEGIAKSGPVYVEKESAACPAP